ncbi:MAG: phosphatase PAP2 family protein [Proteobacteria bacterium]|nr:phosphatase PAP2 family protein [Pseudomonadota bacterium]
MLKAIPFLLVLLAFLRPWSVDGKEFPYTFNTNREVSLLTGSLVTLGYAEYRLENKSRVTSGEVAELSPGDINRFDRPWAGRFDAEAAKRSDAALFSSLALSPVYFAADTDWDTYKKILFLGVEVNGVAASVNQLSKGMVRRHRPRAYPASSLEIESKDDQDQVNSFFSGHASAISSNLFFFGKVFNDLNQNSALCLPVWFGVSTIAALGSWQRVLAGAHFPSDVLLGYLWGGAVGYWVPEMHRHDDTKLTVTPFVDNQVIGLNIRLLL